MTNGIPALAAAAAAIIVACLIVRMGGEFGAGHAIRANRWFRDKPRRPSTKRADPDDA